MDHSWQSDKIRILLVAANPTGTSPLQLQEEIRTIEEKIRDAPYRDSIAITYALAARPDDLIRAFQHYQPHIVHISCHGRQTGEILLLDQDKQAKPVSPEALKELFTALRDNIQLVFLNACYSQEQAKAITSVIDCAIGMNARIRDDSAIIFAASVFRAIGCGRSLQSAFDIGRAAVLMENLPGHSTPQLLCRTGVNPSQIHLLGLKETLSVDTPISTITHLSPAVPPLTRPPAHRYCRLHKNKLILGSALLVLLLVSTSVT